MAKKVLTEADIKKITSRYIYPVTRPIEGVPNIRNIIADSLKSISPKRKIEESHIQDVLSQLQKKNIISDKHIHEAARKVVDAAALSDLKFMVNRSIQNMGRAKTNPNDADAIIKQAKLDPHHSTLQQIRQAVQNFYQGARAIEHMTASELSAQVRQGIEKIAPDKNDPQTVQAILKKYLDQADEEKPIDAEELNAVIRAHLTGAVQPPRTTSASGAGKVIKRKGKINPGNWVPPKNPKKMTFFEKIRYKMRRYGLMSLSRGSRNWLTDTVTKAKNPPSRPRLMRENSAAEAFIGKMFMFYYDAKWKKQLPYWDKFPLIFVIELYDDGWLGLNLHYLPIPLRMKLFDKLLQFADDKSLDKIQRLQLSYQLLKSVSQYPEVRPTIKRYLSSHVKSDLVTVEPIDWEIACFLPVEQFQKQKKETVWQESREQIARIKRQTANKKIAAHRVQRKKK